MSKMRERAPLWGKKLLPGQMFDLPEFISRVTDEDIIADFKMRHPTLSKRILKWEPWKYRVVRVWLTTGMILDHSWATHTATIIKEGKDW